MFHFCTSLRAPALRSLGAAVAASGIVFAVGGPRSARSDGADDYVAAVRKTLPQAAAQRGERPNTETAQSVPAPSSDGIVRLVPPMFVTRATAEAPRVRDLAVENLHIIRRAAAGDEDDEASSAAGQHDAGSSHSTAAGPAEADVSELRRLRGSPTFLCQRSDIGPLLREVCVLVVTRGCHPAVARAVHAAAEAAAAAGVGGVTWYILSDSTPEAVAAEAGKRLGLELALPPYIETHVVGGTRDGAAVSAGDGAASAAGAPASDASIPEFILLDRFEASRSRYHLPVPVPAAYSGSEGAVDAAGGGKLSCACGRKGCTCTRSHGASGVSSCCAAASAAPSGSATASPAAASAALPAAASLVLEAALPSQAALSAWLADVAAGRLQPTLIGAPRPAGDAHPSHPYLGVITSDSFAEVVLQPGVDVALESYLSDCPMCMALAARVKCAAYVAAKFFGPPLHDSTGSLAAPPAWYTPPCPIPVRVAVMNVDENERPRGWVPGPGFPTIQLFNAGAVEALGSGAVDGPAAAALSAHALGAAAGKGSSGGGGEVVSFFSKAHGAGCSHHAGLAADEAALLRNASSWPRIGSSSSTPAGSEPAAATVATSHDAVADDAAALRVVGLAASGSPACVPSLNFSHPSKPGRMALPSVPELVTWLATYCSFPFDPATVRVPASELLPAEVAPGEEEAAGAAATGSAAGSALSASSAAGLPAGAPATVPLLELAASMEGDARALEAHVFEYLWLSALADQYRKSIVLPLLARADAADGSAAHDDEEAGDAAASAASSTLSGPAPTAAQLLAAAEAAVAARPAPLTEADLPAALEVKRKYSEFKRRVEAARVAVVERGFYRRLGPAEAALDDAQTFAESQGILASVRGKLAEEAQGKALAEAVAKVKQLLQPQQ